jgi:hypothetical protein
MVDEQADVMAGATSYSSSLKQANRNEVEVGEIKNLRCGHVTPHHAVTCPYCNKHTGYECQEWPRPCMHYGYPINVTFV